MKRRASLALLVTVAALFGCGPAVPGPSPQASAPPPAQAPLARAVPEAATLRVPKPQEVGARHMVAAADPRASEAARDVLRAGGTAVDAAVAASLVLSVVEPQSSGLGGGGFLLVFDPTSGEVETYDGRERAPPGFDPSRFRRPDGTPMGFWEVAASGHATGRPRLADLLWTVHRRHGRRDWASLVAPARRLAAEGFAVTPRLAGLLTEEAVADPPRPFAARDLLFGPGGAALPAGTLLRNPDLATTLDDLARGGPEGLWRGAFGQAIAAQIPSLAGAPDPGEPPAPPPICAPVRQWRVCGMGPPSSGGIAVGQIVSLMAAGPRLTPDGDPGPVLDRFVRATALAFLEREQVGDPAAMSVAPASLVAPDHLSALARRLETRRAGTLGCCERAGTTHLSIIDGDGMAVALTQTIETAFGSRIAASGALLNNQLTDFDLTAGPDHPNAPRAGAAPRSSMAPTIVLDQDGQPVLVAGSAGGPAILAHVALTVTAILLWGDSPEAALARPTLVWRPDHVLVEAGPDGDAWAAALSARGHLVRRAATASGLHVLWRSPDGTLVGAADPRRAGTALAD